MRMPDLVPARVSFRVEFCICCLVGLTRYVHVWICVWMHLWMQHRSIEYEDVCMYAYNDGSMYVCMYVLYVCMYVWVLIDPYSLSTVPMNWSSTRPTSTPATELIIGTCNRQIVSYHRPKAIMENYLSIHTSIYLYLSIHPSIHPCAIDLSSIHPSIYLSTHLFIDLSIYPFTHPYRADCERCWGRADSECFWRLDLHM